jgi:hypothetical protein
MYVNAARPLAIALLIQLAIGLAACTVLAHAYGTEGAAAGLALGEAIGQAAVLPVLAAKLLTGFDYFRYFVWCLLAMMLAGIWSGGLALGVLAVVDTSRWAGLLAAGAAWTVFGFIPSLVIALPAGQRKLFAARLGFGILAGSRIIRLPWPKQM